MRLPVIVKPFVLNNQSICSFILAIRTNFVSSVRKSARRSRHLKEKADR